jgi:16S rRNA (uracil1498-N3)-methyltransferase
VNLFYQPLIPEGIHYLDAAESKHSAKVLRKKNGDQIQITDGKGFLYRAIITSSDVQQCSFEIQEKIESPVRQYRIHIAIAPTKNPDRLEWFVEKSVELGVDQITLIECDHSERSHLKYERLEKLAISAMKQSLKFLLPSISGPVKLSDVIVNANETEKFIAYVDPENSIHLKDVAASNTSYIVLIGPEGDFSKNELALAQQNHFKKVSLGPSRLRTETAGLAACHILNLVNT